MGKIWLKSVDPSRQCCGCEGKTSPCDSCCAPITVSLPKEYPLGTLIFPTDPFSKSLEKYPSCKIYSSLLDTVAITNKSLSVNLGNNPASEFSYHTNIFSITVKKNQILEFNFSYEDGTINYRMPVTYSLPILSLVSTYRARSFFSFLIEPANSEDMENIEVFDVVNGDSFNQGNSINFSTVTEFEFNSYTEQVNRAEGESGALLFNCGLALPLPYGVVYSNSSLQTTNVLAGTVWYMYKRQGAGWSEPFVNISTSNCAGTAFLKNSCPILNGEEVTILGIIGVVDIPPPPDPSGYSINDEYNTVVVPYYYAIQYKKKQLETRSQISRSGFKLRATKATCIKFTHSFAESVLGSSCYEDSRVYRKANMILTSEQSLNVARLKFSLNGLTTTCPEL